MKTRNLIVGFLCAVAVVVTCAVEAQAKTPSRNARVVSEFLEEEGYSPEFDDDGDIYFKKEGGFYYILFDSDDDVYFRIYYPKFWSIDDEEEFERAEAAAKKVANTVKCARILMADEYEEDMSVSAIIELFCDDPSAFTDVFDRSMSALSVAVKKFVEEI